MNIHSSRDSAVETIVDTEFNFKYWKHRIKQQVPLCTCNYPWFWSVRLICSRVCCRSGSLPPTVLFVVMKKLLVALPLSALLPHTSRSRTITSGWRLAASCRQTTKQVTSCQRNTAVAVFLKPTTVATVVHILFFLDFLLRSNRPTRVITLQEVKYYFSNIYIWQ